MKGAVAIGPLGYLEVRAGHTLGQLPEERLLHLDKLGGLDDVQDLLQFVEEHHLFRTVGLGPILQQSHDRLRSRRDDGVSGEEPRTSICTTRVWV